MKQYFKLEDFNRTRFQLVATVNVL